jgi:hypothetical protein
MVRPMRLTALLLCAAACGNPDNLVIGGISASGNIPVATIDTVRSAISGIATVSDRQTGAKGGQRTVVVLSNAPKLCDQLAAHPDYFRNPPEDYAALVFFLPLDRVGTFFIGRDQNTDAEIVAGAKGTPTTPYSALGTSQGIGSSYIALTDVSGNGGNARGSFSLYFVDRANGLHNFYGRFKTGTCSALENALLP